MSAPRRLTIDLNSPRVQDNFNVALRGALSRLFPPGTDVNNDALHAAATLVRGDHTRLEYTHPETGRTIQLSQGQDGQPYVRYMDPRSQTGAIYNLGTGQVTPLPHDGTGQQFAMTDQDRQIVQGVGAAVREFVRPAPVAPAHTR